MNLKLFDGSLADPATGLSSVLCGRRPALTLLVSVVGFGRSRLGFRGPKGWTAGARLTLFRDGLGQLPCLPRRLGRRPIAESLFVLCRGCRRRLFDQLPEQHEALVDGVLVVFLARAEDLLLDELLLASKT